MHELRVFSKQKKHQLIPGAALAVFLLLFASTAKGSSYDFYVDAGSVKSEERGTQDYPFKTIGAAMNHIKNRKYKNKNIYIKKGTYSEQVKLENGTNLVGEDRSETTIDGSGRSYGIYFRSTNSRVSNLTVKKASKNIKVNRRSKAFINNCTIKEARGNGVEVDKSKYSNKYKFTFKNSSVKDSGKRGMYISRRKIEIVENEISGNDEEGIDFHTGMRGSIRKNEIKNNGESGIEMMVAGTKISIKENSLSSNDTHGITIQVYGPKRGTARLTRNSIRNNDKYGVRYARYDRNSIKIKYWKFIKKCVKLKKNTIENNLDGNFSYI
jgi:hypothetical protein